MKTIRVCVPILIGIGMLACIAPAVAQNAGPAQPAQTGAPAPRPTPPTRDPNTPGYVTARELPDGAVPPTDVDGNFILGPTHNPAPEMTVQADAPQGTVSQQPAKPIRIWMEVGDRNLLNPNVMRDNMHDWVVANQTMARTLAAKGYHYQFVFARNAGHCDRAVKHQTFPAALEWLWKGTRSTASRILVSNHSRTSLCAS